MVLQITHRRFANLLHDLRPEELERTVSNEDQEPLSLRRVLEMAASHYRQQTEALESLRQTFKEGEA